MKTLCQDVFELDSRAVELRNKLTFSSQCHVMNFPFCEEGEEYDEEEVLKFVWYEICGCLCRDIYFVCTPSGNIWWVGLAFHYYFDRGGETFEDFKNHALLGTYLDDFSKFKLNPMSGVFCNLMGVKMKGGIR